MAKHTQAAQQHLATLTMPTHFYTPQNSLVALLPKEALEKAKTDAKMLKTSFWPPSRKGHAVEAIASFPLSCI